MCMTYEPLTKQGGCGLINLESFRCVHNSPYDADSEGHDERPAAAYQDHVRA